MNVLVTGATGFIGRHVVTYLKELGHKVYGTTSSITKTQAATKKEDSPQFLFKGEADDIKMLQYILNREKIDTVIHLAADSAITSSNPHHQLSDNTTYMRNLLEACKGQKFIFASTVMLYGNRTTCIVPDSEYSVSKLFGEILLNFYLRKGNIRQAISLRMCGVLGPGLHKGIVHKILTHKEDVIQLRGQSPGGTLYFLDIEDCLNAIVGALDYSESEQVDFNLVPSFPMSLWEIAEMVNKKVEWSGSDDNRNLWVSNLYSCVALDWKPQYSSVEAVERYKHYLDEENENLLS